MSEFGNYTLCMAWLLSIIGIVAGTVAGLKKKDAWYFTAKHATIAAAVFSTFSLMALGWLFLSSDFSNQYVWQYSNRDMPAMYRLTAIWGGMDGSMLLWVCMLCMSAAMVAFWGDSHPRSLMAWTLAAINSCSLFFLTITTSYTNPFRYIKAPFIPPDGNGLNPLLQNPYMAFHPPTLYLGFTMLAVPYAFCMGALLSGRLDTEWIRLTRRWTLTGWGFLTAGIMLGGHWAYVELGWGGFWAWDPVENASFLPWLTATAFLHSVMVQERKGMLKLWNIWLVVLSFGLTVFGTFLTRSGVVQSVHAFAETDIGEVFLQYLAFVFLLALVLTIYRRRELKSERKIEHFFSREAAFLLNNLVLLSICFATIWGVLFPILSEAVTGEKQNVGIPYFNTVNVPLFLGLIFLMGVGPLIAWRKASLKSLKNTFLVPFVLSLGVACLLVWAGIVKFYPVLSYSLCFFVTLTILMEFHRGIRVQRAALGDKTGFGSASVALFRRHRSRYGGYIVHLGVVIAAISITASMAHKFEKEFTLAQGEKIKVGRFALKLVGLEERRNPNYESFLAAVEVSDAGSGKVLTVMRPEKRFYILKQEQTTEVALRMSPREDLYLALAGMDDSGKRVAFKVFINPLQIWLWFGGLIILLGTVIVLLPDGLAHRKTVLAKEAVRAK